MYTIEGEISLTQTWTVNKMKKKLGKTNKLFSPVLVKVEHFDTPVVDVIVDRLR